jgi:mannose-6-phosphate isomerase
MPSPLSPVLYPIPAPSIRPWAGVRLGGGVGELWLAGPDSLVEGPEGAMSLDALSARHGAALVGARGMRRLGARFPLLVKLIDAGDWLSLQVHPSDALARRLHGPDAVGKAEAWLVLAADADARLVTGPRGGLLEAALRARITTGTISRDDCESRAAVPGEMLSLRAGTIHAIGAGVFVYEIEQPSDLTYRISDWGRPAVPGRRLHTAEALEAIVPTQKAVVSGAGFTPSGGALVMDEFQLEVLGPGGSIRRGPGGQTPEVVSVIDGPAVLAGASWQAALEPGRAIVVPAACEAYTIEPGPTARVLVGSLPA